MKITPIAGKGATLFLATLLAASAAQSKTFRNAYVSFDLADRWNCVLEQTEWVCRTQTGPSDPREAVIILTAKEVGPSDTLSAYEQHLKTPRSIASRTGQPIQSQIMKVEQRTVNAHVWIDGMHLASEVPNYYSRYLATTKDKIAILVTFSAHKNHYSKYSSDFFKAIESLRVIATKSLMGSESGSGGSGIPGEGLFGSGSGSGSYGLDSELPEETSGTSGKTGIGMKVALAAAFLAGVLGLLMILLKKPKSKKKK